MKTTLTKTTVTAAAILLTIAAATVAKSQISSDASDTYFEPKADRLQAAPGDLAVVRPTHFPEAPSKIKHVHGQDDSLARTVGRNVTFRELMAEACDCEPGRVVLPPDAPKGSFDFLVTALPNPRQHLREAIKKELGYTASSETRDTEVLVLRVKDPGLPGLAVSVEGDSDINYQDGKLNFSHQPLSLIVKGLENGLAMPVMDRTGLTNYYDFSVAWSEKTTQAMREGGFHLEGVQKCLAGWGLELTSDTARLEMFTVKKTR